MRTYNRQLEMITPTPTAQRAAGLIHANAQFVANEFGIDAKRLQKKLEKLTVMDLVKPKFHGKYYIDNEGVRDTCQELHTAKAWVSCLRITPLDDQNQHYRYEPAVFLYDQCDDHTIRHELFHFLSAPNTIDFDDQDHYYLKCGLMMKTFDRHDRLVDDSLNAESLNEGLTEWLTCRLENNMNNQQGGYTGIYLADILAKANHHALIKAYFNDDNRVFAQFLQDFAQRQNYIKAADLCRLSLHNYAKPAVYHGCLAYALSYCQTPTQVLAEKERLNPTLDHLATMIAKTTFNRREGFALHNSAAMQRSFNAIFDQALQRVTNHKLTKQIATQAAALRANEFSREI